jgi:hypothetical protein
LIFRLLPFESLTVTLAIHFPFDSKYTRFVLS